MRSSLVHLPRLRLLDNFWCFMVFMIPHASWCCLSLLETSEDLMRLVILGFFFCQSVLEAVFTQWSCGPVNAEISWPGSDACPREIVQRGSRERFPSRFFVIQKDQELAPALQRQYRNGTKRDSWTKQQNCHFWELKEELKRTEKNLKELKLSK